MKYHKEKLELHHNKTLELHPVGDEHGIYIVAEIPKDALGDKEANAQRLVACWNACEGIETKHILKAQRFSDKFYEARCSLQSQLDHERALNAENAELVNAVKKIIRAKVSHVIWCNFQEDSCARCNCGIADIKTAIAKASKKGDK